MSASSSQPPDSFGSLPPAVAEAAATWLARRDRGLTPQEQDEYLHWLQADPRHAEAVNQHAAALERMMQLYEWQPSHDTEPNPDLFAAPRRGRWWAWSAGLAAAAALVVGFYLVSRPAAPPAAVARSYLRVNERVALPDGSRAELKDGTQLQVRYSEAERRVKLTGGEAHFTVWKDPARPFVVEAGGVEVRAVGTAFDVRLGERAVEVLVTEGRVRVEAPAPAAAGPAPVAPPLFVSMGERTVVPLAAETRVTAPAVVAVTPEEIRRELVWQAPRLQFYETPLVEAVAEFNRLNRHQLVIADPEIAQLRIGGTFRPDNVEGFVRLLDTALGVRAERVGDDRTLLRRGR